MRAEKKNIVKEFSDAVRGKNPMIFANYANSRANDLTQLRMQLRMVDSNLRVVKNRLFQRVVKDSDAGDSIGTLKGPTAVAYGGRDVAEVVKVLIRFVKQNPHKLIVRDGLVDGQYLEIESLEKLAKLPSRNQLLARLVGQINAPISRWAMVLNGNLQKLVCVLNAIKDKQDK